MKIFTAAASLASLTEAVQWKPTAGMTWNIELVNPPKASQANDQAYKAWDFDLFDSSTSLVSTFKSKDHDVICYFSAGTAENWRPDYKEFPADALGNKVAGWAGERWVDTRNPTVRSIMKARIQKAASMGCDAVDPDNIDAYENNPGFPLTKEDAISYVTFLATTAHDEGLACGLKNGGAIVESVLDVTDFCVSEQCSDYTYKSGTECLQYQPFIKQNKPVFHLEYTAKEPAPAKVVKLACDNKDAAGFSNLIKHLSLNAWTETCP